jgi:hypothetical protein
MSRSLFNYTFWRSAIPFGICLGLLYTVSGAGGYLSALLVGAVSGGLFGFALSFFTTSDWVDRNTKPLLKDGEQIVREGLANHFQGIEAVGGRLVLTNERVIFKSHPFNIQTHEWSVARTDISETEPARTLGIVPNGLLIKVKSGETERFVVRDREGWCQHVAAKSQ